ncbi:hypothetical protein [Hymenobacter cavernae]|uniref:Uncharacterized protein n=1 Tax=Hymenobacter cavernae TaxID=2044852 RepID=A0ABQ1UX69_9BACT|nr:hypothetical protein [Hymenobacter cavernae]GGF27295.1 hypothetical protein GCM10011383_43690 [Hymenobacter cavernae]
MRQFLSVLLVLCSACGSSDFRPCPNTHIDLTKQLYNDVIIEIIEQRLHNAYLPKEDQQVIWQHFVTSDHLEPTAADSVWVRAQKVHFQQQLFQDTARFQTFYLRTMGAYKTQLANLPTQFTTVQAGPKVLARLAALITALAPQQPQAALDSLNTVQQHMQAQEFQLCTAKLVPLQAAQRVHEAGGTITLSSVVFNAHQDQALLAYSWQCGPRCGLGEALWVERVKGRWRIKQAEGIWIA